MREIERHIVRLLLDNDCVIVPGFGGFLAHRIPASYNKAEGIFLPPSRTIGFNPLLTMNDSLLAQAYANCYDISYPEALKHIDNDVAILKQTIESEGELNICGLGRIVLNQSGSYDFQPDQSGFVSPELYGLDTFEMSPMVAEESVEEPQLEHPNTAITMQPVISEQPKPQPVVQQAAEVTAETNTTSETQQEETKEKEIAIRIPMRTLKHIAAACIAIIILLSVPSKLGDSSKNYTSHGAIDTSFLYEMMPKEITNGKPEKLNTIAPEKEAVKEVAEPTVKTEEENTENEKYFTIVLASRVARKNAEEYAKLLQSKGIDAAVTSKGGTKVTYKKFKNKEEAQKAMRVLSDRKEFNGCWITEIK